MWLGLVLQCGPAVRLANILPFFGSFVGLSVNVICGILALMISVVIIALSWLAHRPLVSVALLLAIAGAAYLLMGGNGSSTRRAGGNSGGGGLAACLCECASLKDDSTLFDICSGACVKKYA
jgi:hypothetical protein